MCDLLEIRTIAAIFWKWCAQYIDSSEQCHIAHSKTDDEGETQRPDAAASFLRLRAFVAEPPFPHPRPRRP